MQECLRRRFLHRQAVERVGVGAGSSYVLLRVPWSESEEALNTCLLNRKR